LPVTSCSMPMKQAIFDTIVPVVGQVVGRSISLVFELEAGTETTPGMYIFGTGATRSKILDDMDCGGTLGGTFGGPEEGDIGDWGARCYGFTTLDSNGNPTRTRICFEEPPPEEGEPAAGG
jgi:hypothetical protein